MRNNIDLIKVIGAIILIGLLAYAALWAINRSTRGVETKAGNTVINGEMGSCQLFIVEKDGHKFAVLVGYGKCAITQVKP